MLIWLQSILTRKRTFFLQIVLVSFFLHLLIFVVSMIMGTYKKVAFSVSKNLNLNAPIVFVPLAKTIPGALTNVHRTATSGVKAAQVAVKKPIKSNKTTVAKATKEKDASLHTLNKSLKAPKATAKKQTKELVQTMVKQTKPIMPTIKEAVVEPEPIITEEFKELAQSAATQVLNLLSLSNEPLLLGREDLAYYQAFADVQHQVNTLWTPPAGFSDLECNVKAVIDNNGTLIKISIERSSGSLAYDVSAKMAFQKIEWPKNLWSKEIVLTFRQ